MAKDLVLMVDDELDNRVMMRYFLESWGYEVELAANGQEALDKVAERRPSLVLLDLEMPVMDGFETCNRLKGEPETENIPVIMFTGLESTADKVKGIKRGADDYVVKTVDPEEIQARIEMILRRSKRYEAPVPAAESRPTSDAVLSGSLEEKSFPEAFQLAMAYGKSGTFVIEHEGRRGNVYLTDGAVVHAEVDDFRGVEAFYELAVWNQGSFSYVVGEESKVRSIEASGTSLLMEATRRMDEWNLIQAKIPSLDAKPHRVATASQDSIRITRMDWKVLNLANGQRSIREIAEELEKDTFDIARLAFGLLNAGAMSFEADKHERDFFFDAIPELRPEPKGEEPFELSSLHWKLLAAIDGKRDLGVLTHLVGLAPRRLAECLKELAERGFVRVNKPRPKGESAPSTSPQGKVSAEASGSSQPVVDRGKVEAFTPRIRAIGFD